MPAIPVESEDEDDDDDDDHHYHHVEAECGAITLPVQYKII